MGNVADMVDEISGNQPTREEVMAALEQNQAGNGEPLTTLAPVLAQLYIDLVNIPLRPKPSERIQVLTLKVDDADEQITRPYLTEKISLAIGKLFESTFKITPELLNFILEALASRVNDTVVSGQAESSGFPVLINDDIYLFSVDVIPSEDEYVIYITPMEITGLVELIYRNLGVDQMFASYERFMALWVLLASHISTANLQIEKHHDQFFNELPNEFFSLLLTFEQIINLAKEYARYTDLNGSEKKQTSFLKSSFSRNYNNRKGRRLLT